MKRKRIRRTAEQQIEYEAYRRQSDENLRRLRELVDRGWADLRARQTGRREAS
jgi:hypothetical protein